MESKEQADALIAAPEPQPQPLLIERWTVGDYRSEFAFAQIAKIENSFHREIAVTAAAERAEAVKFCNKATFFKLWRLFWREWKRQNENAAMPPIKVETVSEIYDILMSGTDEFCDVYMDSLRGVPIRVDSSGNRKLWTDSDDSTLRSFFEQNFGLYNPRKTDDALRIFLAERPYNPVQREIEKTEWDGVARCETFFKWMNCEDSLYTREVARLFFAGGIARAFAPGCKFDCTLVLIGGQGSGKSTLARWLALDDDFFSELKYISGKAGLESIQGKWICEIPELLATIANEREGTRAEDAAKAFLTTLSDFYRQPYDKRPVDHPRSCVFIGTTNRTQFLTDRTGGRRWLPLHTHGDARSLYEHEKEIKAEIRLCWAEALHHFRQQDAFSSLTPKPEALEAIKAAQSSEEFSDYREGLIEDFVAGKTSTCLFEIWAELLHPGVTDIPKMTRSESNELAEILTCKLHWTRGGTVRFPNYGPQKAYYPPASGQNSATDDDFL